MDAFDPCPLPLRPPYPPGFRAEAVELIRSGSKSIAELSRDLGVTDQTPRNWLRGLISMLVGATMA